MEKECIRCHRTFYSTQPEATLCPDCLKTEFKAAAPTLDAEERKALVAEFEVQDKRQISRAERMRVGYQSGAYFSWAGQLRFLFGLGLFFLTVLVFFVVGGVSHDGSEALDILAQRIISLLLCVLSAALIVSSMRRFLYVVLPLALVIAVSGWYLPGLSSLLDDETPAVANVAETEEEPGTAEFSAESARALKKSDLDVFYQQKNSEPQTVHYAVYMSRQDSRTRTIVRDALSRLLGAEYTRAYTRNDGALFVVSRVRGRMKNISRTLSRFGHITYSSPSEGIYEVRFDPEKVNMVSRYPVEVLAEPSNASYVTANIEELLSLDPMRIRSAAKNLHMSNVQMLRNEVRDTLLTVMQDPWSGDFDTYSALAEATTTYAAGEQDEQVIDVCRKFFRVGLAMKREMPASVTNYLVKAVPDEMVEPIVEFWCENPIAWTDTMAKLGTRTQAPLLEKLKTADNIRRIGTIIRYLKDYGDARAVEPIKPFLTHQDSIIRHTAQDAIRSIEAR